MQVFKVRNAEFSFSTFAVAIFVKIFISVAHCSFTKLQKSLKQPDFDLTLVPHFKSLSLFVLFVFFSTQTWKMLSTLWSPSSMLLQLKMAQH